jgi:hypothetical protein
MGEKSVVTAVGNLDTVGIRQSLQELVFARPSHQRIAIAANEKNWLMNFFQARP